MNLIEIYVQNKYPDIIKKRELNELTRKVAMKWMLIICGMMVFYMGMITYNMYLVVMKHEYANIFNLVTNIILFFLMRWCIERVKYMRNKV